jgi:metallophosphoesterase (TIGR00282 family)
MKILFVGDIFGKPGREIARRAIPALVDQRGIDFVIANVENCAAGFGVTGDLAEAILSYGVDVMTSGNHVWDKKEVLEYIPRQPKLLRPANFPAGVPGRGSYLGRTRSGGLVGVINLMGRVFMTPIDDPFAVALREIEALRAKTRVIVVDFHAEATSEKIAMGWHLDGRVTAVVGTHTHVQTADERILPKGTAYQTDAGMTGPHDSIIGVDIETALGRFLNAMPVRFEAATGPARLNAVELTADAATGKATRIERLNLSAQDLEA